MSSFHIHIFYFSQYFEVTKTSTKHNTKGKRKMREQTSFGELKKKVNLERYICRWEENKS